MNQHTSLKPGDIVHVKAVYLKTGHPDPGPGRVVAVGHQYVFVQFEHLKNLARVHSKHLWRQIADSPIESVTIERFFDDIETYLSQH